jgi:catechol 2,3-dioxygenase-like lactoylglutathione lyase family enzyme
VVEQEETAMLRFDHLTIPVSNWTASRDWYIKSLGLKIEFEVPERRTVALQDQCDFTIFLVQDSVTSHAAGLSLTFQVEDVQKSFEEMSGKGVHFAHPPQKVFWGYGAELYDPDGYSVRLWDEKSMKAKG